MLKLSRSSPVVRRFATLLSLPLTTLCLPGQAANVNWLDPLGYTKPAGINIPMPDEAAAIKYYVDFDHGSNSQGCGTSDGNPCATLRGLTDRNLPGLSGNPDDAAAYVYLRGTGAFFVYNNRFAGTPGKEIVVKPWAGYTYTSVGDSPALGTDQGDPSLIHDIIVDGGENLAISFVATQDGSPAYALHIDGNNITLYRTRVYATATANLLGVANNSAVLSNLQFINNEFYGCNQTQGHQCSALYIGACSNPGSCAVNNVKVRNNIIRGMGGEAIEVNPRGPSYGIEISGNAIHDAGKQTCGTSWDCRPGITIDGPSVGGTTSDVVITNNLIWDTAAACIWDEGGGNPSQLANNTCYDYGKMASQGSCTRGICGNNVSHATVSSNIVFSPAGADPFDYSPFAASNNVCASGKSCGDQARVWSSDMVLSTDPNNPGFMALNCSSCTVLLPVRNAQTLVGYSDIQAAYDAAASGNTVQAIATNFSQNLTFNNNVAVALSGGYDSTFMTAPALTTVSGSLTIGNGSLTIEGMVLQ
jgi:hypothetical protein